jgi:uncharacterized protein (DUF934 family)
MPLVRAGRRVEDRFVRILGNAPLPDRLAVLLPAARFLVDVADVTRRMAPAGVIWPNDRRIDELAPHLDHLALVALEFPRFRDGRAYSQARRLRERYGFRGELRATGQVLRDQFLFLLRAGFDAFEVAKEADVEHFIEVTRRYNVFYQPSADGRPTAMALRLRNPAAAKTTEPVR